MGFDYVWFLGLWQTGQAGREVSLSHPEWLREFAATLPDFTEADVSGSPFAVTGYTLHKDFGPEAELLRLKERLRKRDLKLIVDFVPNHTAPDHPWVQSHPEFYVQGSEADLERESQNYRRVETTGGSLILAYGRDPYFSGWPDTFQLNYRHPGYGKPWPRSSSSWPASPTGCAATWPCWFSPRSSSAPGASGLCPPTVPPPWTNCSGRRPYARVKAENPGFIFMAEVYWDLEWTLMQQGFDYCYDKSLYDRLLSRDAAAVHAHLWADLAYQNRLARFLENHDRPGRPTSFRRPCTRPPQPSPS